MKYCLSAIAWLVCWGALFAQTGLHTHKDLSQYSYEEWQTEDGLPQNSISCIIQTHDGYIWLGTLEGLVRFDGVRFTVYDVGNTGALQSNRIVSLFEDHSGVLWIGTEGGGVTRLSHGKFTTFTVTEGLLSNSVGQICEDKNGILWLAHTKGITQVSGNGNFTVLTKSNGLPGNLLGPICSDQEGNVWLGSDSGLVRYDGKSFHLFTTADGLPNTEMFSLCPGSDGSLWIGTTHCLARLKNGKFSSWTVNDGLSNDFIWSLCERRDGSILIGTQGGGLNMFKEGRFSKFTTSDGLSNNVVWSVFEDREGLIWIGTNGGGLTRLKDALFTTYGTLQGLVNDFVWSVCQSPNGDMWFATYDGVSRYSDGKFQSFTTKDGLSSHFVWSVYVDHIGQVWVGTVNGLEKYSNGRFAQFKDSLVNGTIRSILETKDGALWVGTTKGACMLLPGKNSRFIQMTGKSEIEQSTVMSMCEGHDGSMWLGTTNGLQRYKDGKTTMYTVMEGLTNEMIRSLYEDPQGNLWIGTQGGGLNLYRNKTFTAFTQRQGLYNNVVSQILEDNDGDLWMSCNKGIFRVKKTELLDFASGKIRTIHSTAYGKDDGMKSPECNGSSQPAGWKSQDGRLWFPTIKGVAVVNPEQEEITNLTPPVIIENVLVNKKSFSEIDPNNITAGSGDLEVQYTGLTSYAPEKVQFKYRLTGYDDSWKNVGTRRTAYYTNLSPGTYTFWVSTIGNDSTVSAPTASFTFRLLPHFYQEQWFYLMCAIVIGGITFGGYRFRMQRVQRREHRLVELVKERTQNLQTEKENAEHARVLAEKQQQLAEEANKVKSEILHIAAHDMKSPLISIKMYAQIIGVEVDGKSQIAQFADDIYQNSQRMLDLINELLDASAIENGKITIQKTRVNISKLAESVAYSHRKSAESKDQMLFADIGGDCFIDADESRVRQVMDNLISNAIKYSPSSKPIWVKVHHWNENVRIEIRDEGPGLTEEDMKKVFGKFQRLTPRPTGGEPSTGLGLSVVKHLVEIQHGKVWVESEPGKGCNFIVEFKAAKMSGIQAGR